MSHVNIEVVEGSSYTTLKQSFIRGQVYRLNSAEWENLRNAVHPVTNKKIFEVTTKAATQVPGSTEREDVIVGGGITITHAEPEPMSAAELEKAGLGAFGRRDRHPKDTDKDTGASMVGTGGESEVVSGPSGHEGLDDDEGSATVSVGDPQPAQGPQVTHAATPVAPAAKKVVVGRPVAPKRASDDEVKV